MPGLQLLSNGSYHVAVTASGHATSCWERLAITRWCADATLDPGGAPLSYPCPCDADQRVGRGAARPAAERDERTQLSRRPRHRLVARRVRDPQRTRGFGRPAGRAAAAGRPGFVRRVTQQMVQAQAWWNAFHMRSELAVLCAPSSDGEPSFSIGSGSRSMRGRARMTPAPCASVIANPDFGTFVSESGSAGCRSPATSIGCSATNARKRGCRW